MRRKGSCREAREEEERGTGKRGEGTGIRGGGWGREGGGRGKRKEEGKEGRGEKEKLENSC